MAAIKNNTLFLIKIAVFAAVTRMLFACAYYFYYIRISRIPLYSFDGESGSVMAWYIALLMKGANVMSLPMSYVPVDCWVSDRIQVIIASFNGNFPAMSTYGVGFYAYFLGLFYYIFGYAPLLFRLFNILVGIATAFVCYRMTKDIFGEKSARIVFILMLILPYQFLYSASLQRDTIVNFLCALTVFAALAIKQTCKLRLNIALLSLLGVSLISLYFLRFSAFFMMIAALFLYMLTIFYYIYKRIFIVFIVLFMSIPAARIKLFYFFKSSIVTFLTHHISFASYGGSIYKLFPLKYYIFFNPEVAPPLSSLSVWQIFIVMFKSLRAFLFEPVILNDFKMSYLFVLPEMAVWYVVLAFCFLGMICAFQKMNLRILGLLMFLTVFSLVIGMSGANMDALVRHRGMISFIYVMFSAYGISAIRDMQNV